MTECAKCVEYRELIDGMRKYMSVGSYAQNTPKKVLNDFKMVMSKANKVSRERYEKGEKNE